MPASIVPLLTSLLVALPFLSPWTGPPLPNLWSLMLSWACIALLALLVWSRPAPLDCWARRFAWGLLLAAALSAGIGLLQYFGLGGWLSPWAHAAEPGLAYGQLRQRNQLASLLNLGAWAALWLWAQRPRVAGPQAFVPLGLGVVLLLMALACAATASRTGALQWLLIGALLWLWAGASAPGVLRLYLGALLVYGLAAVLLPWLLESMQGRTSLGVFGRFIQEPAGCESRSVLWANVLTLIAQRPWTGWGWGELDYAHYITAFAGERFCDLLDNAHNLPLQLAVELGLPLAALAAAAVLAWLWRSRPWAERVPARQLAWGVLALLGLHSLLEYPLWYGPFQLTALVALALLWPAALARLRPPAWALGGLLGLALALGSSVLWDYHRVRQLYLAPEARDPAYRALKPQGIRTVLFDRELNFALLTTLPLTPENAARAHALALDLLHYSPEPAVIEALIGSACLLGKEAEVALHVQRYRAAYPLKYARWQPQLLHCPALSRAPAAETPAPRPGRAQTP